MGKLVRQAGKLYLKAEQTDKALAIFVRGGCSAEAGEVSAMLGRPRTPRRATTARPETSRRPPSVCARRGRTRRPVDSSVSTCATRATTSKRRALLEEAGDLLEAGDLYRSLEQYEQAATVLRESEQLRGGG